MNLRPCSALRSLLVVLVVALADTLSTWPATAATPGYVRLAHLSPDTPEVDVWVTSFRGGAYSKVLPRVGYGALSDYQRVAPGTYAVAMRPPGAPGKSTPMIRTTLRVAAGRAYTVAGIGRNADLSLRVLTDDLARPSSGKARMRVVQASSVAPVVDVTTTDGQTIARGARFPSTTPYAEIDAQQWTLRAKPQKAGAKAAQETVDVRAGFIYTALVLDDATAGVQLVVRADAAASASAPIGSVNTGLGGSAAEPPRGWPSTALVGLLAALLIVTGASVKRRRRG